jgi:hypothetical protein
MSINYEDRVARNDLIDLVAKEQGMDRDRIGMQQRRRSFHVRPMLNAQLGNPVRLFCGVEFASSLRSQLAEHQPGVTDNTDLGAAIMANLLAVEVHVDELCVR